MPCSHDRTRQTGSDRPFTAPVACPPYTDEWRAAHGSVTYTETCLTCGAERATNQNGLHLEHSPWSPARVMRERSAQEEKTRARDRLARLPLPPTHTVSAGDGRRVTVELDPRTGEIAISGAEHTSRDAIAICAALPSEWLEMAKRYRQAVIAAAGDV